MEPVRQLLSGCYAASISKTGGTARVGDYDISDPKDAMKIRKMIGIVHDNVGLYDSLSPYENLEFFGRMYGFPEIKLRENIEKYLKVLDLWGNKDKPVGSFSKGMKQKVAIARSLVHEPDLLFMDEPTANLDPEASKVIRDIILNLKKENRTIFLNTHNLDEAQRICDRIGILNTKMMAVDTPANLERAMTGKKTIFVLETISDKVLNAVKASNPENVEVQGNSIILELKDPDNETSTIMNSIIAAGGKIKSVNESGASLEDVYLKLVRG